MPQDTYTYTFAEGVDLEQVLDTLMLAIVSAEGVYGAARVRMDARCRVERTASFVAIDAATDVGQHINRVFTNFLTREFGAEAFEVRRLERHCAEGVET